MLHQIGCLGITPAYAGKSCGDALVCDDAEDHPRLCGEKLTFISFSSEFLGSPPPMRGKVSFFESGRTGNRITPAYAGKSSFAYLLLPCVLDHPRLCGEK